MHELLETGRIEQVIAGDTEQRLSVSIGDPR